MGTGVAGPGRQAQRVTSTDASVGPYRLCSPAQGSTSWNASWVRVDRASPLQITRRSERARGAVGSRRNTSSMDGTKCAVVTDSRSTSSARYTGSRCPPGLATTRVAPNSSGQKNSQTDTSNPHGVFCRIRSSAVSGYSSCIHSSRLTTPSCDTTTPLGLPVEPEVKIVYAGWRDERTGDRKGPASGSGMSIRRTGTVPYDCGPVARTRTGAASRRMPSTRAVGWSRSRGR